MQKNKSDYKKVKSLYGTYEKIPEDWDHSTLSNFLTFNMGQSPPSESYNENQDGLPFFQGVTEFRYMYPEHKFWCSEPKKVAKKDQILFSVRAPVGEINISKTECCIGRGLTAVIPKNDHLRYCYYSLYYFKNHFIQYSQGTTYDAIDKNSLKIIKIPYTSNKNEQQKIASILSGVDALIESTQKVIEKTERLKKGVMQYLLTTGIGSTKFKKVKWYHEKEIKIPNRWKWSELGKEGSLSSGATPRRDHPEYYDGDILWVSSGELDYNFITTTAETINVLGLQKTNLKIHSKGTFLFAITGLEAKGTRGRCAILGTEATTNQSCMAFYDSNSLDTKFLFYYFLTFGEKIIFAIAQGTKQQSLNLELSKKIKVPIPPLTEQQKIASILSGVDAHIQKNQEYKEKMQILKKGLMQKLLTGKIRVNI